MTEVKNQTTPAKPVFDVYSVKEGNRGGKDRWIPVGVAFPHEKGNGFNILLDALPLAFDGKLVVRLRETEPGETA